jgi:hypothetical protein
MTEMDDQGTNRNAARIPGRGRKIADRPGEQG